MFMFQYGLGALLGAVSSWNGSVFLEEGQKYSLAEILEPSSPFA